MKAARGAKWPAVSLSVGYNTAYTSASDAALLDQFNQRRGGSVALGFSLPIFDRNGAQTATERARIDVANSRLGLEGSRQDVGLQVRRAWLDRQAALERYRAALAQQQAAQLAHETSQERYRAGAGTLVEVVQARAAQVQAASQLVTARGRAAIGLPAGAPSLARAARMRW